MARKATATRSNTSAADAELRFRPSARLQRFLGRELISDPNLAILEFVKNSYDAGASEVRVSFQLLDEPTTLVIVDDGVGMDYQAFQENWMHPGFSAKSDEAPPQVRNRTSSKTAAGRRSRGRTPVGEKGLGRLAAGRLGEEMDVYTRPSASTPWLHVHFDWSAFDDMTVHMDEVIIPYDYTNDLPDEIGTLSIGTAVVIRDLQLDWAGRVRGRPVTGRSRTRLGRLREDLQLLLRPLALATPNFVVELWSDDVADEIELGPITPETAVQEAPYRYDFEYTVDARGLPHVERTLFRNKAISREFKKSAEEDLGSGPARDETGEPVELACGPFSGSFLYRPPPSRERAKPSDIVGHGVLLYRDDVLVEPYGLGSDDWVGVEARKAQRQGHALIQPNTFWGEVRINRRTNPQLRDMANRQGLLDDAASEEFFALVRSEFRHFEDVVGTELEQRWKSREDRASEAAKEQLKAVLLRTKSFAHHLRQPLMGMGGELIRLERLASDDKIPKAQRDRIGEIHQRLVEYHDRAEHLVNKYATGSVPEYEAASVHDLMEDVVAETNVLAGQHDVMVELDVGADQQLVLPRELLEGALVELTSNAIEADRPPGRPGAVVVRARVVRNELVIRISDTGTGMPKVADGTPLSEVVLTPTKGRPADGLPEVCNVLAYARGSAVVEATSEDGTTIEVRVPARLRQ